MTDVFIHPYTKKVLKRHLNGNLFSLEGTKSDVFLRQEGCYDFVSNPDLRKKREVYDKHYTDWPTHDLTLAAITEPWVDDSFPWYRTMLKSLGSLSGRKVLLLGNGMQYKEFFFLHLGAYVVFTDLSLVAARRAQSVFRKSELSEKHHDHIEFHAVDAMHLPFPDESFDVIYGHKFVGFLESIPDFFSEVQRCLKPWGICRFSDDAFSPAWDTIRRNVSQPIKARFRWKSMSDLDRIRSGDTPYGDFGFREESLAPFVEQFGFKRLVFIREYFFLRIAQLFWAKLFGWDAKRKRLHYARPLFLAMKWFDNRLAHTDWMRRNALPLIFGFDK